MSRTGNLSLTLQLPLAAALCALLVGLCTVWLAGTASSHMQREIEARYGNSLAEQIALATREALQSGDLLAARATLERFLETSEARAIAIRDVEGATIGAAGLTDGRGSQPYRAVIAIGGDIAGEVLLTVNNDFAREDRWRFIFSLLALVVALSLLVFMVTRGAAARFASRLRALQSELSLPGSDVPIEPGAEIADLERTVASLPLEMLRGSATLPKAATRFEDGVIVFVHLASLARYVDTLSENNLHRYSRRLQQIVQAAAHCYRGEYCVTRPFGLVLRFRRQGEAGGEALVAASCARLIALVAEGLRPHTSLSLDIAMAVGRCEETPDDVEDMYPQLHLQGAIDDLRDICLASEAFPSVQIERELLEAAQLSPPDGTEDFPPLGALAREQEELLAHQARLIVERIAAPRESSASA